MPHVVHIHAHRPVPLHSHLLGMGREGNAPPKGDCPGAMGTQHHTALLHRICQPVRLRYLRMELIRPVLLFRRVQRLHASGALHTALCEVELDKDPFRGYTTACYRLPRHLLRIQPHHGTADRTPEQVELFWTYNTPNVAMMTIACFLMIYRIRIPSGSRTAACLANLTACGFGIYMIHYFFVCVGYDLGAWLHIPDALRIPFSALVILACSWTIVALARKLLGKRSKYILG